jgi:hypothetical protein
MASFSLGFYIAAETSVKIFIPESNPKDIKIFGFIY